MHTRGKSTYKLSGPEIFLAKNSRGQAVIEYVLLLVVTVSIVIALVSQLFKPFGNFVDAYMGTYFSCLLEYGELPKLNSAEETPAGSECRPPKIGAGDGSNSNNSGGGGGSGGSGEGESQPGGDRAENSRNNSRGSDSSSNNASSGSYAGSASRGGSRYINSRRSGSLGSESRSTAGGGKVVEIAADGNAGDSFFGDSSSSRRFGSRGAKKYAVGIAGLTESQQKKLKNKESGGSSVIVITESVGPPAKKIAVKKPEVRAPAEEEKPFTIGNFIRYLFIAALVIALVLFIGGQALQMSKSSE